MSDESSLGYTHEEFNDMTLKFPELSESEIINKMQLAAGMVFDENGKWVDPKFSCERCKVAFSEGLKGHQHIECLENTVTYLKEQNIKLRNDLEEQNKKILTIMTVENKRLLNALEKSYNLVNDRVDDLEILMDRNNIS